MPDDNLVNFLDKPHEEQVNAAIDADNAGLVQVLLGQKYCQLWQYWLVHGIIASKALNMERITHARLFLSIINKQEKVLEEQKKLLEERKKFLESSDKEKIKNSDQENQLKKSRHFVRDLLIAIRDAAVECRDDIVRESNQKISYREFYTPHNLLRNQDDNGAEDLEYVTQQISTISSAENLTLINEVDNVIIELNKEINDDIWKQSDTSTKVSYYLGEAADRIEKAISGENGRTLDQAMNVIPENVNVSGRRVPLRAIANGIVAVLRYVPAGILSLSEWTYDNINSLACVEGNLKEIERFISKIEEIAVKKQDLSDKLTAIRDKIESQVMKRMNDGKFIDKQFVKDMYRAFLYNYLDSARSDSSDLLYHDIKRVNGDVKRIAEKISAMLKEVNYEKFEGFLNRALRKENPNFDVISVLIVNSSPLFSYNCTDQNANRNLKRLMRKSFQTVMIDVHYLLFDFDRHFPDIDVDVSLLSFLPNRDGSDNTRSCKNNIMLKGNKKYQAVLEEVKKFADEIDKLVEKGGLNRVRGYLGIPSLWYLFYDFCQYLFSQKKQNLEKECEVIDKRIREFLCKAAHSIATGNEGMMKEYIEDIEERMANERNSDVLELYKIVLGMRLRDRVFKREDMKSKWLNTPKNETLDNFIVITSKRVNELGTLKEKDVRKAAEERADAADQRADSVEKENEKLKAMLRGLGVDPNSDLSDVNIAAGASFAVSIGKG